MMTAKAESVDVKTNVVMNLKNFTIDEFDSPDLPGSGLNMDNDFLQMLDIAREIADIPFKINSGYRTKEHNKKVGGKSDSSHLVGKAVDISYSNSRDRWIIITALQEAGFNRLGIAKTFVHTDSDQTKSPDVIWTY
jgi:zinc D-Ala-D-Ala carboxypeptidase